MIRVRVGADFYDWSSHNITMRLHTDLTDSDIMLHNIHNYDTYIVNKAHLQPNICVFASLCKKHGKQLFICGKVNNYTKDLLDVADEFKLI